MDSTEITPVSMAVVEEQEDSFQKNCAVETSRNYAWQLMLVRPPDSGAWSIHPAVHQAVRHNYFDSIGLPRLAVSSKA